jgi:hypothetical protein
VFNIVAAFDHTLTNVAPDLKTFYFIHLDPDADADAVLTAAARMDGVHAVKKPGPQ